MSTAKTQIEESTLLEFFRDRLQIHEPTYEAIAEGEVSQAYFFESEHQQYVLRFNKNTKEGFLKDKFAAERFSSAKVPIPQVTQVGEFNGMYYSVSERAPGNLVSRLSTNEVDVFMPELISTLDAIHSTKPAGSGYGFWSPTGEAVDSSWADAIMLALEAEDDSKLASVEFFNPTLHDHLKKQIKKLIKQCPYERKLVHGDYGFKNLLSDGKRVTGVIDWHGSRYGDPLFDIAWLEFWRPDQGYSSAFHKYYQSINRLPTNYEARLKCYMLVAAVTAMAFFAKSNQPLKYDFSTQRVAELDNLYLNKSKRGLN